MLSYPTPRSLVWLPSVAIAGFALAVSLAALAQDPAGKTPVHVKIEDEKSVTVEAVMPVDPVQHAQLQGLGNMLYTVKVNNQNLHLGSVITWLNIDGQVLFPGNPPGRIVVQNQPLPATKDGKARNGSMTVYEHFKLTITMEIEVVPTKNKLGEKRRLDAVMVRYLVDNQDTQPHKVGIRVHMLTFLLNNRGALFAAPTHPDKVLDGIELKGDKVPDYVRVLQTPDVKNPGFVAHVTYALGAGYDRPSRVLLTRGVGNFNLWDLAVMPAGGISMIASYWDPQEIKPGTTRKIAYGYGQGQATSPDGDGIVAVVLGGSFEPGKLFTVAAQVQDPAHGQSLTLELPPGMERVEGKERQPVPPIDETGNSMVLWKARVLNTGRYTLRVHSSTGVTQTKIITITRSGDKTAGS